MWGLDAARPECGASAAEGRDAGEGSPGLAGYAVTESWGHPRHGRSPCPKAPGCAPGSALIEVLGGRHNVKEGEEQGGRARSVRPTQLDEQHRLAGRIQRCCVTWRALMRDWSVWRRRSGRNGWFTPLPALSRSLIGGHGCPFLCPPPREVAARPALPALHLAGAGDADDPALAQAMGSNLRSVFDTMVPGSHAGRGCPGLED